MKTLAMTLSSVLGAAALLFPLAAAAADTFAAKDTVSVIGASTVGENFYFWTTTTTGTCGNGTKWSVSNVGDDGDKEMARLAEMAFMSGSRVAMTYTCSGSTAIVSYIKVYR